MEVGDHPNLIRKEEYVHGKYMALEYAIAKSLFNYLAEMGPSISKNNEQWTRYLFRQFIAGL